MTRRTRSTLHRRLLALAVVTALALVIAPSALAADSSDGAWVRGFGIGLDVVIVRPLRTIAVVIGAACFVPAAIVTSPGGSAAIGQAFDKLVQHPFDQAFRKPLGEI